MQERASERVVADKEVYCLLKDRRAPSLLYNLSIDGCMIDVPDLLLKCGDTLSIELEDEIVSQGMVVWEKAGCVGVKFDERIHEAIVQYLGFRQPAPLFVQLDPVDRFGRRIPNLPVPGSALRL